VVPVPGVAPVPVSGASPRPLGGTELYGYLPYWEMTTSMAGYLASVPLTTIALSSVSAASNGGLRPKETGYVRITGSIGARLIADAHRRGQRVELVFTSFNYNPNSRLFGRSGAGDAMIDRPRATGGSQASGGSHTLAGSHAPAATPPWQRTASELLALAKRLGVDGINVDVEFISGSAFEGYTEFLATLRRGLDATRPGSRLSVATMASADGADLARAAIAAGVDRVFMMGYEYHWSGSQPGGSAPIQRLDGTADLNWSIAQYTEAGVPADRMLLGLPLYGMSWPVASTDRYAPKTGNGTSWIPANHVALLTARDFAPTLDHVEMSEFFTVPAAAGATGWRAVFYDSPRTLRPKLELARARGYAGSGFWAIGYERGLPGYLDLMREFRAGEVTPPEPDRAGGR
jgi:glycosyl hydrolase family 18 (putative chitinase)